MEQAAAKLEQIQQDLVCPACEYNLRGLAGAVVTCPECGVEHDVARLIARKWIGRWCDAPGFSAILTPVTWSSIGALGVFVVSMIAMQNHSFISAAAAVVILLAAVWITKLIALRELMPGGRAVTLSLFAHALLAGYLLSLVAIAYLIITGMSAGSGFVCFACVVLIPVPVVCFWLCRRGEKFIGEQCIRNYLERGDPRGGFIDTGDMV